MKTKIPSYFENFSLKEIKKKCLIRLSTWLSFLYANVFFGRFVYRAIWLSGLLERQVRLLIRLR
jgi:hypothetical protein